ncbi:MAG: dipeptidase [Pseudomonadota bacterium]
MRKIFAWAALLLGIASIVFFGVLPPIVEGRMNVVAGPQPPAATARAAALHKTLQVADMHADTLMWKRDFMERGTRGQVDFPRLTEGNVALQILSSVTKTPKNQNYDSNSGDTDNITLLTIAQGQPPRTWTSLVERSLWHSEKLHRFAAGSDGHLRIVQTKADLAALLKDRAAGKAVTGTMLSVEGLQDIEGKRANLDRIFNAGFRMAGLAHFFDNEVAGSMHGVRKGGLTPFGVEIVRAMEAKGMVVDIAHCSHTCVAQVLAMAKRPVVSSHGGVQATCKVNRNLTDDEIRGVAKIGGVVGIGYWDAAVCDTSPAGIVRAIAHVRDLVGIDYVGLGSDFDGAVTTRFDTTRLDAITQGLIDAGFSDADIAKVMGGNVFRVLAQVLPN